MSSKSHHPVTSGSKKSPTAACDLFLNPEPTAQPQWDTEDQREGVPWAEAQQTLEVRRTGKLKWTSCP